jgi:hypothetical protein
MDCRQPLAGQTGVYHCLQGLTLVDEEMQDARCKIFIIELNICILYSARPRCFSNPGQLIREDFKAVRKNRTNSDITCKVLVQA